jgi:hypothetical protein
VSEAEALALLRRILADALERQATDHIKIRDLAGQNGALKATMRVALVVIDTLGVDQ